MRDGPLVIGLNIGHDGGCVLLRRGELVCGISEERLSRNRYGPGWARSLLYVMEAAGIALADVDLFVFSSGGPALPERFDGGLCRFGVDPARITTLDHHASHAWSAHCLSGEEETVVLVVDALGNEDDTESWWRASAEGVERLGRNPRDRTPAGGIGFTYEAFTNWLGFADQESGKVMALAAFGDPDAYSEPLFDIEGLEVRGRLRATHQWGVIDFARRAGLRWGEPFPDATEERAQHVAAYVQRRAEEAVVALASEVLRQFPAPALALAGGVALNCVINSKLRAAIAPRRLYIPPAASDVGQPLGNAFYGHWRLTGSVASGAPHHGWLGRSYSDDDIRAAIAQHPSVTPYGRLRREPYEYSYETDPADVAAQLLADGRFVGWFQGGSEFGPRALGRRSILADPRSAEHRDHLNANIKHREWFRPFAPSVAAEHAEELVGVTHPLPYMLEAPELKSEWLPKLAGVAHVDGTARAQTVTNGSDARFHRLITQFAVRTGVPAVLNTSFNDREPIVESPGDALMTFQSTRLDALVINEHVFVKKARC